MSKKDKRQKTGCSCRLVFLPVIFIVLKVMKLTAAIQLAVTLGNLFILAYLHWLRELEVFSFLYA